MIGSFSISRDDIHCCVSPPHFTVPFVAIGLVLAQYTDVGRIVCCQLGRHFDPPCKRVLNFFCSFQQLYQRPLVLPHALRVNTNDCAMKNTSSAASCEHSTAQGNSADTLVSVVSATVSE
jgi:hypothetical protein